MIYSIVFTSDAETDVTNSYKWYEEQSVGLGEEFLRAVDASINTVIRRPTLYPIVHKNIRRTLVRRFPYGLFYLIEESRIVVLACLHAKRHPRIIGSRDS